MEVHEALALICQRVRDLAQYDLKPETPRIKLNQNENPWDWPQAVKEQAAAFCRERPWNRYPNFVPEKLRRGLAEFAGVSFESILAGNGSNEMLTVLLISLVNAGSEVLICQPTFTVYSLLVNGLGGRGIAVLPRGDLRFDVEAVCAAIRGRPGSLLIACSPNNPTGSTLSEGDLRAILEAHTGFLILDQAYVEFGGFNAIPLLQEYPNLIITRTFSKAMGGAGLRIGYLLGRPEIIAQLNKIKMPYNINFFSEFVAETLLGHSGLIGARVAEIVARRETLFDFLRTLPFENVYPSGANFLLVRTGRKNELFAHLARNGILVRDVSAYPMLENCLRITIGAHEEDCELRSSLASFFAGAGTLRKG